MRIYTKTGDAGLTTLYGGTKVKKSSLRVCAYGAVDEANSFIGLAAIYVPSEALGNLLRMCQQKLFVLSAELASDNSGLRKLKQNIKPEDTLPLEQSIDELYKGLRPNSGFVIPGRTKAAAYLHTARTMVRRAERAIVALQEKEHVSPYIIVYMNRLSDLLYAMSRAVDEYCIFQEYDINKENRHELR